MAKRSLIVYTDGSYIWGQRNIGFAFYALDAKTKKPLLLYAGFTAHERSSNSLAELYAIKMALKHFEYSNHIHIITDCQYIANAFNQNWIERWFHERFKKVKHPEIWQDILKSVSTYKSFQISWVKGHSNCEENKLVDSAARKCLTYKTFNVQSFSN